VTAPPPEIDLWDGARARAAAPGLWRVYDEVFGDQDSLAIWRQEVLDRHSERDGFRLAVARCEHEIVGFAYGYVGERGQPWADRVAAALPPAVHATPGTARHAPQTPMNRRLATHTNTDRSRPRKARSIRTRTASRAKSE